MVMLLLTPMYGTVLAAKALLVIYNAQMVPVDQQHQFFAGLLLQLPVVLTAAMLFSMPVEVVAAVVLGLLC